MNYAPVPTLNAFHKSDARVRGVIGPFSSGKSVGMCWEILFRCMRQRKNEKGKRRSRWAVVRNTSQQLKDTSLKTWLEWFPEDDAVGHFKVSDMTYELRYGDIEADILFRALDKPGDVRRLLSLELTGVFVNEAREIPWAIIGGLDGRISRYPPANAEGCTWSGIIMDTNPPDEDHWWYDIFEMAVPPGVDPKGVSEGERDAIRRKFKGFHQPPGAVLVGGSWVTNRGQIAGVPAAENLGNMNDPEYYANICVGKDREYIKVYAEGKYGILSDGKPVFPGYDDDIHCLKVNGELENIPYDPRLPLFAGQDSSIRGQGFLIGQVSERGQLRVLQEVVSDDAGLENFTIHGIKPKLSMFSGDWVGNFFDPNANKRTDLDETQAITYLNGGYEDRDPKLPFYTVPASTNSQQARIDAVNHFLLRLIPKAQSEKSAPAFIIDGKRCPRLRKGLSGRYEFKKMQIVGEDQFKEIPNKNRYSHVCESLEYLCLGVLSQKAEEEEDDHRDMRRSMSTSWSG